MLWALGIALRDLDAARTVALWHRAQLSEHPNGWVLGPNLLLHLEAWCYQPVPFLGKSIAITMGWPGDGNKPAQSIMTITIAYRGFPARSRLGAFPNPLARVSNSRARPE